MIRYSTPLTEIESLVDNTVPNWRSRARLRATRLQKLGRYYERSSIWSEVKPVFMRLQYNKCAYCEQRLEGGPLGAIAHDLEHYRPKSNVRAWPQDPTTYPFSTGDAFPEGYYKIAYHLGNFVAACKVCNTLLKSDNFPIAADRIGGNDTPAEYAAEKPFLIYPIGDTDDDPEDLIAFFGVHPLPRHSSGDKWRRAWVMIDFLGLDRESLQKSRAYWLIAVWEAFKNAERGDQDSMRNLRVLTSTSAPHTSCVRYFVDLCGIERTAAQHLVPDFLDIIARNDI